MFNLIFSLLFLFWHIEEVVQTSDGRYLAAYVPGFYHTKEECEADRKIIQTNIIDVQRPVTGLEGGAKIIYAVCTVDGKKV